MNNQNPFWAIYNDPAYQFAYKRPLLEFPLLIDIEATNRCNLNCVMCTQQIMTRTRGHLSIDLFRQIISEAVQHGCKGVRFILYGEPLLNPALFSMITYAHRRGLLTHLTTNGLLLTKWRVDSLLKSGLDSLIISFQGTDRKGYEEMRGTNYNKLMANLDYYFALNTERPFTQITTTILDDTPQQIAAFKEYWHRDADAVDVWETNLERVKSKISPELYTRQRLSGRSNSHPCNEIYSKMNLFWNGDCAICCDDANGDVIMGKFPEQSLYDIWHGDNYRWYRDEFKQHLYPTLCYACHNKF